jgi:pectate lyase
MRYTKALALISFAVATITAKAQMSEYDLNTPFGWTNCQTLTTDGYSTTGGGNGTEIVLVSTGDDMRSDITSAIKNNDIIIFDGSKGDFIISYSIDLSALSNKTIVGINGARLCSKFYITDEITKLLDEAGVKNASTSSGTGGTLSNGSSVSEACEYKTRQTLIDYTDDTKETYRKAGIFNLKNCKNIIIRNLKFVGPGSCDVGGYDLISSTGTTHLWVDHCEFTDGIDGNFDITKGSDFVTVSWCTFSYTERSYNHQNCCLIGSSDSDTGDLNKLNVTFANCMWGEGVNARMPMVRFGNIHMLNNYFNCPGNGSNAINPRKSSEVLVESNYFEAGVKAFGQSGAKAYVWKDNINMGKNNGSTSGSVSMPYEYTAYNASEVPTEVATYAGATLTEPLTFGNSSPINGLQQETHYHIEGDVIYCNGTITIYNIMGSKVMHACDRANLSTLTDGIYIVTIKGNTSSATFKITKR